MDTEEVFKEAASHVFNDDWEEEVYYSVSNTPSLPLPIEFYLMGLYRDSANLFQHYQGS